jgi:uncharacterized protein (TIGR02466 family)
MNINPMFASMVATTDISVNNARLENYCYSQFIDKNGQSNWLDLTSTDLSEILLEVTTKLNWLHTELGFSDQYYQKIDKCWANINNSENTSHPHCHVGMFFNAIYYIKAEQDNSELVLLSPVPELDHVIDKNTIKTFTPFNATGNFIKPHTGLLVIIPGWLKHYVKQDTSSIDRISIVFDSIMIKS